MDDDEKVLPKSSDNKEDFLRKARERFKRASDFWTPKYDLAEADEKFSVGNSDNGYQWPDYLQWDYDANVVNKRPRLTINKLWQFHNNIVNDYRQSSIGMKAEPQQDEDMDVAKAYYGLFRQIEKQSNAQVAYVQALSNGARGGLGWLRVITDYCRPDSFDQDIFIKRVVNPRRCFPDPDAEGFFFEDGAFFFFIDRVPLEQFKEDHPDIDPTDFITDDYSSYWRGDETNGGEYVIIAEYFYFKSRKRTLNLYEGGVTAFDDDEHKPEGKPLKSRKQDFKELHWCRIDGYNVLEEAVWPKPRIPFAPVWGNEIWVEGERTFEGQVRGVKDSQRMYNYMQSAKTEMIAIAPKAPYIAAEGQLEGDRELEWRDAATTPKSVLYYKPMTVDGVIVPPPQRQAYEAPVAAVIQASMQASDDMKAVLGVYDASLGARGNEVSGRAINARKAQGEIATYNYVDNLALGIGYLGTIIAEIIPVYYDTQRRQRIINEENKPEIMDLNGPDGPNVVDVNYDLILDTGPSYASQRDEAAAILMELSNNFPKLMEVGGDIAVRNMNFKGNIELADRLKRTLPPQVVGEEADPVTKLAAAQTQLEQAQQLVQQLTASIQQLKQDNREKDIKLLNKTGELKIKQQEVDIKKAELLKTAKEDDGSEAAAVRTDQSTNAVINAVQELSAQVAELADMVEAVVSEDEPEVPTNEGTENV